MLDTELSFFRYVTPAEDIYNDPKIRPLFEDQPDEICFFHNFAASTSIVTYRCEGGKARAINVFGRRPPGKGAKAGKIHTLGIVILRKLMHSDRSARASRADLLDMVQYFHPSIKAILEYVTRFHSADILG